MKASQLNVGDRIRIVSIPDESLVSYKLAPETRDVYESLIRRGRPVRLSEVDEYGPWFDCRFKAKDGKTTGSL